MSARLSIKYRGEIANNEFPEMPLSVNGPTARWAMRSLLDHVFNMGSLRTSRQPWQQSIAMSNKKSNRR